MCASTWKFGEPGKKARIILIEKYFIYTNNMHTYFYLYEWNINQKARAALPNVSDGRVKILVLCENFSDFNRKFPLKIATSC